MGMKEVILRELKPHDEGAFYQAVTDWQGHDLTWLTFEWRPGMKFDDHLEKLRKNKLGLEIEVGRVASSMLYGFVADQIIGRVSIRHDLNQYLLERGGHIGYSVAPKFRGQGLGRRMVQESLPYIKEELGLQKILITCSEENTPSVRIIESLGAVLENQFYDEEEDEQVNRYWLVL